MTTRREFLLGCGGLALSPLVEEQPLIDAEDLAYLRDLAKATILDATKSVSTPTLGFAAITPGGNYPALWVRDFSMGGGCGLVPPRTIENHLKAIARAQNGPAERRLGQRALIPPHAIADHVNYDGKPVFYPGTYSSGDDQGGEPYGVLPPADDHYEFIHLAYLLWKRTGQTAFLSESINSLPIAERLVKALNCPRWNPETGLVETDAPTRAVGFGFCDGIYFTGALLFASLLRYRALGELTEMGILDGKDQRRRIERNLPKTFGSKGWLKAATGVGQQPDVWGTAYAIYLGAVTGKTKSTLLETLAKATREGKITYKGAVRHVPTDHNFSKTSAWEQTAGIPINRYQNGAYWHVPSGWLATVLWQTDKPLARQHIKDMVSHFRKEQSMGAPWECLHPDGDYRQNPIYMASVTLPLEAIERN